MGDCYRAGGVNTVVLYIARIDIWVLLCFSIGYLSLKFYTTFIRYLG